MIGVLKFVLLLMRLAS